MMLTKISGVLVAVVMLGFGSVSAAQAQDVRGGAGLTGATWGLCKAYCEVMDCDGDAQATDAACQQLEDRYLAKSGGAPLPCEPRATNMTDKEAQFFVVMQSEVG